jgi:Caenorhabditis protein of unknown function, DUF268
MRKLVRLLHWLLYGQMGISPGKILRVFHGLPRFFKDAVRFKKHYQGKIEWMPCLTDWYEEGGAALGEYFWQDLYVARKIFDAKPHRHIDIGSRVDGFVAHVASFREIEVFDIRPNTATVPGIVFRQADLMSLNDSLTGCCDSISCLHALEHFGLGRYGDPIDPLGYEAGLQNMAKLLSDGGVFYLSVPIGTVCVQFNAHRVFNPKELVKLAEKSGLILGGFAFVDQADAITESIDPEKDLSLISRKNYALGIFTFRKN